MMQRTIKFKTTEGLILDIITDSPEKPRGILLVWPCTMGDVRMYKVPTSTFLKKDFTVLLYNPRGHGKSEGEMDYRKAVNDLELFIGEFNKDNLPVTAVGHSGGCGGLLAVASETECFKKMFFISPVIDSRKSLFYMYANNTIHEFNMLVAQGASDQKTVLSVLSDANWLDKNSWVKGNFRDKLDEVSKEGFRIGSFLESLFIEGINRYKELKDHSDIIEILLPSEDNWYPVESTREISRKYNIPTVDSIGAVDHYFTKAWKDVWSYVEGKL